MTSSRMRMSEETFAFQPWLYKQVFSNFLFSRYILRINPNKSAMNHLPNCPVHDISLCDTKALHFFWNFPQSHWWGSCIGLSLSETFSDPPKCHQEQIFKIKIGAREGGWASASGGQMREPALITASTASFCERFGSRIIASAQRVTAPVKRHW